ncbi:MAG: hypothetical protein AABZ77_09350, partial [Chloroflexota bacterium]
PSLHTATPLCFYNLGARYFPEKEPELRQCIGDVVSTVIKTKLHALIDIAFGIFLSKKTISHKLGLEFYDLESFFTQEQKGAYSGANRPVFRSKPATIPDEIGHPTGANRPPLPGRPRDRIGRGAG